VEGKTVATKAVIQEQLKKERLLNRITHQLHDTRDLDEILLYLKDEAQHSRWTFYEAANFARKWLTSRP
jgi:hypothetical protein